MKDYLLEQEETFWHKMAKDCLGCHKKEWN